MTTARDIIRGSLRLIGESGRGIPDGDNGLSEGLEALNMFIQSLSSENLMIPERTEESFTLTVGQDNYTIGSGGDLNTTRPMVIEEARLVFNTVEYSLKRMRIREYNRIPAKNITAIPERYYYEPVYPLGILKFDYEPDKAYTLFLSSLKPLATLANLSTVITIQPEYLHFLKFNLAPILGPEYGKDASQFVIAEAMRAKAVIKKLNSIYRIPQSSIDTALVGVGSYNINRD